MKQSVQMSLNGLTQLASYARGLWRPVAIGAALVCAAVNVQAAPEISVEGIDDVPMVNNAPPSAASGTDFLSVPIGDDVTHTFTIRNTGTEDLEVTGFNRTAGLGGERFTVTLDSVTIPPGGTHLLPIKFDPNVLGTYQSTVRIFSEDEDENPLPDFYLQITGFSYDISDDQGPYGGGNQTTITGASDGAVSSVTVDGNAATIIEQVGNAVTIELPKGNGIGLVDIVVFSDVLRTLNNAYEYLPQDLTLSDFFADDKPYDATTDVPADTYGFTLNPDLGDDLEFSYTVAFDDANAGVRTVNFTDIIISGGADAANYTLLTDSGSATASILQAALTVTAEDKTHLYNNDVFPGPYTVDYDGFVGGEDEGDLGGVLNFVGNAIAAVNAGTYTITPEGLTSDNYAIEFISGELEIERRELTIDGGFTAFDKTYDRTTDATGDLTLLTLDPKVPGTDVDLDAVVIEFEDRHAGAGKLVSITSAELTGADKDNYTLSLVGAPTDTAEIFAKGLDLSGLTAKDRFYDTTVLVEVLGSPEISGVIAPDDVTLHGTAGGEVADPNVGVDKQVTVTGLWLDGADAANYTIDTEPAGLEIDIDPAKLTIGGLVAQDKEYDGTTAAVIDDAAMVLDGVFAVDELDVILNGHGNVTEGTFRQATVGEDINVFVDILALKEAGEPNGIWLTGAASGNYEIDPFSGERDDVLDRRTGLTELIYADINKAVPDITTWPNASDITYCEKLGDSELTDAVHGTPGTFAWADPDHMPDAGLAQPFAVIFTPDDTDNYLTAEEDVEVNVLKRLLTVTAVADDVTYGDPEPKVRWVYDGFCGGDTEADLDDTGFDLGTDYVQCDDVGTYNTTIALGTADDNNYEFNLQPSTFEVIQREVTITGLFAENRAYNLTTDVVIRGIDVATLDNIADVCDVFGADVWLDGPASILGQIADRHAEIGKEVTSVDLSGVSLDGPKAGNYTITGLTDPLMVNITRRWLDIVDLVALDKIYDRTDVAEIDDSDMKIKENEILGDDEVILQGSVTVGTFAQVTVGVGIDVVPDLNDLSLAGANAGDYRIRTSGPDVEVLSADITQRPLTVGGLIPADKVYDGNTDADVNRDDEVLVGTPDPTEGVVVPDDVNLIGAPTFTFADPNAADDIDIIVVGYDIDGADAFNYTLSQPELSADITQRPLTVNIVGNPDIPSREYDGTTEYTDLEEGNFEVLNAAVGEGFTISQTDGTFNSKDVVDAGTITATLDAVHYVPVGPTNPDNYILPDSASGDGEITVKTGLIVEVVGNPTKVYDGNDEATLAEDNYEITGLIGDEEFTITQTDGTYADPNVGVHLITVDLDPATDYTPVDDALLTNYELPVLAEGNGTITKALLTVEITGNPTKEYDGNTDATLVPADYTLSGLIVGENFTITKAIGTYDHKDVWDGVEGATTVTVELVPADFDPDAGTDPDNYTLPVTVSGPGTITPKTGLTVDIVDNPSKVYDGNDEATLDEDSYEINGMVGAENFTITQTVGTYNSKDVVDADTVTAALTDDDYEPTGGALKKNYDLPNTAEGLGAITERPVTVAITGNPTKMYDDTDVATLDEDDYTWYNVVDGESLIATQTVGTYASKEVGEHNVTADLTGEVAAGPGTLLSNYELPDPLEAQGMGTITPNVLGRLELTGLDGQQRIAGVPATMVLTAYDIWDNVKIDYVGTIEFTSTDPQADLPAAVTFTVADAGTMTFPDGVVLKTAGWQTVTATDTDTGIFDDDTAEVLPADIDYLTFTGNDEQIAGDGQMITVTARDEFGNVATYYNGLKSITFSGSDPSDDVVETPWVRQSLPAEERRADFGQSEQFMFIDGVLEVWMVLFKADPDTMIHAELDTLQKSSEGHDLEVSVLPGEAVKVLWAQQPAEIVTYGDEWTEFAAQITDHWGNRTLNTDEVTVTPSVGAFIAGDTTVAAIDGLAEFSGLFYDAARSGITLTASADGLDSSRPSVEITVVGKTLTVAGAEAQDKPYDGTTDAVITGGVLDGVLPGDVVEIDPASRTGTFAQADAGSDIAVTAALALTGADAGNYILQQPVLSADIGTIGLTIGGTLTAHDKEYDATADAQVDTGSLVLNGLVAGETMGLKNVTAEFEQIDAGDGLQVVLTGAELDDSGAYTADAANYTLSLVGAPDATADIMAKVIAVVPPAGLSKVAGADDPLFAPFALDPELLPGDGVVGDLSREGAGEHVAGTFAYTLGTLDAGPNYHLIIAPGAATFEVQPGTVDYITMEGNDEMVAGTSQTITITARDAFGNVATGFNGRRNVIFSGANPSDNIALPPYLFDAAENQYLDFYEARQNVHFVNGVKALDMVLFKAELAQVDVMLPTEMLNAGVNGLNVTVKPAKASKLLWVQQPAEEVVYGDEWPDFSLEISDWYGNRTTDDDAVTISASEGYFTSAGSDMTVNAVDGLATFSGLVYDELRTGITLTAASGVLMGSAPSTEVDVLHREITVTAVADQKVYDGTTDSGGTPVPAVGSLGIGDASAFSQTYDDKHVGDGKTMTATGSIANIDGTDVTSSYIITWLSVDEGEITPRPITVTAVWDERMYDGTTDSVGVPTASWIAPGDTPSFSQSFDDKNVGDRTMLPAGRVIDGNNGDNYDVTFVTAAGRIIPRPITVTAVEATKVYDGTLAAPGTPVVTSAIDLAAGDVASFSQTFEDKNVGEDKTLIPAGTIADADGVDMTANYDITWQNADLGEITLRPITVTAVEATKVYDGTTDSDAIPEKTEGTLGVGDKPHFSQEYDDKHVGVNKTMTPSGTITDEDDVDMTHNYDITWATVDLGEITQREITVTAVWDERDYDGTTDSVGVPTASWIAPGDTPSFSQSFDDKNVGDRTMLPAGSVIDGNNGDNYDVSFVTADGRITQRAITVTAVAATRVYDGTIDSDGIPEVTEGSLADDDVASFSQVYDDKHVGVNKTMTPSGTIADSDDVDMTANYDITWATADVGEITERPITVTAVWDEKVYDGTTDSSGMPLVSWVADGDTPIFGQHFDDKRAGDRTMIPFGHVDDGNNGDNYDVSFVTDDGLITTRPITVTAVPDDKVYDGNNSSVGEPEITEGSLVAGDVASFSQTFDNEEVGREKTLTPAGTIADAIGADMTDSYAITWDSVDEGTIRPDALVTIVLADISSPREAGQPASPTVTLYDQHGHVKWDYTGTVTFSSSDAAADLPADYTFEEADEGVKTFAAGVVLKTVGTHTVKVQDVDTGIEDEIAGIVVNPGPVDYVTFVGPDEQRAGEGKMIQVTARDAFGNVATYYDGLKSLTFTGSEPSIDVVRDPKVLQVTPTAQFEAIFGAAQEFRFIDGTAEVEMVLYRADPDTEVRVKLNTEQKTSEGHDLAVNVIPGNPEKLRWVQQPASEETVGLPWEDILVEITDFWGNRAPESDEVTLVPSVGSFTEGDTTVAAVEGLAEFSGLVFDQTGEVTLTATAAGLDSTPASDTVTVLNQTPVLVDAPDASAIVLGQSLAASMLTGGQVENAAGEVVDGDFSFDDEAIVPDETGWYTAMITFTPVDETKYNSIGLAVDVYVEQITVTFDAQGGDYLEPPTKGVVFGEAYGTLAATTRGGHSFRGWFTEPDKGGVRIFATTIVDRAEHHTLYAGWDVSAGGDGQVDPELNVLTVVANGDNVEVTFSPSVDGYIYSLQFTDDLSGDWISLGDHVEGNGDAIGTLNHNGGTGQSGFYRVVREPMPE